MDYLYRTLSAAGVEDERVKMMLQRPYIDPLDHNR
jgi:hypothetical protein